MSVQYVAEIDARLRELGFELVRINGSHRIYRHVQTGRGIGYAPNESATKLTPDAVHDLHRKLAAQGYQSGWFPPTRARVREMPCQPTPIITRPQQEQEQESGMGSSEQPNNGLAGVSSRQVDSVPGGQKMCRKCGVVKSFGEFYHDATLRDGLMNECKACRRDRIAQKKSQAAQAVTVVRVAPAVTPQEDPAIAAVPAPEAAPEGFTLADWLELHQAADGPSAFVTSEGFVILVLRPAPDQFEAWILTEDGSGPGQPVPPSLLDYVVRLLTGAGRDASRKLTGHVYY